MTWTKSQIIRELSRLHKSGADLSYNALARRKQALLSAAAYHFGSYRGAVQTADIDYARYLRRPRWTKSAIIALIKQARRRGHDLHWSAVTRRGDDLARAAYASLQPRLFGSWARALHAAGLHADDVSMYRDWDRNTIVSDLRERYRDGEALNSGEVQKGDPGLHAAVIRHFGHFDRALRASGVDPARVRLRRAWDRSSVVRAIRTAARKHHKITDAALRRIDPALHGASVRLFGSFRRARAAAGLH